MAGQHSRIAEFHRARGDRLARPDASGAGARAERSEDRVGRDASDVADAEAEAIERALRESDGKVGGPQGAAAKLGMKRTTLQAKMRKLGIEAKR
ncbi:MAG: helix-turn-helix domain-containing protein [Ignavibacteriota bacterium]